METEKFDFAVMKNIYENGQLKDRLDCKNYISKFFYPLTDGNHAYFEYGKFELLNDDRMTKVYLKRFPKDIKNWYNTETIPKKLICDVLKPRIGDDYVNMTDKLTKEAKPFSSFPKKTQKAVKMMLDFFKKIWANSNEESYLYLLKWFTNVVKGHKNISAIYAKCIEGIGKSTFTDFFINFVMGSQFCAKGDAGCLTSDNNMLMMGKPLVVFEELPVLNEGQWTVCDGKLKDLITGNEFNYSDKYIRKITARNISNFIVLCNFKTIKNPGRRYYIVDLNTMYENNFDYFSKLRDECYNKEVGYAFYCFLNELDMSNFLSCNMPMTETKKDSVAELLPCIDKFLKFNYILREKNIDCKLCDLHNEYKMFVRSEFPQYRPESIQGFNRHLKELGLHKKKNSDGLNVFDISINQIKAIAERKHWIHDLDKDIMDSKTFHDNDDDYDNGVTKKDLAVKMSLDEEIEHYKKLLNDLELKRINEWNQSKPKQKKVTKTPKQKTVTKTIIPTIKKSIVDEKCDNIKKLFESYN